MRLPGWARAALAVAAVAALAFDGLDAAHRAVTWITPTDGARVIAWGLPCAVLIAAAALGERGVASRMSAGLVALGDASYALYLVHPFVVLTLVRLYTAGQLGERIGYWPFVGASLTLAVAAAFAVHRWIERPAARVLALRRLDGKPVLRWRAGDVRPIYQIVRASNCLKARSAVTRLMSSMIAWAASIRSNGSL